MELIKVIVDSPLGSKHPTYPETIYPINYGHIEGVISSNGKKQDAYILGIDIAIRGFLGKKIATVYKKDDDETKWIICSIAMKYTKEEILSIINFQEHYFDSDIEMLENVSKIE